MKIRTLFILIILVGCESLQKKQSVDYLDEFKGYSGHILYIDDYPNAKKIGRQTLSLPLSPSLKKMDVLLN